MLFLVGSPLEARQNSENYSIFVYFVVFAVICIFISFLIKFIKEKLLSQKQRADKPTNLSMILRIAKVYDLTLEQRDFLIKICKKDKVPNLEVNFHSENFFNNFFFKYYHAIKENKENLSEDEVEGQIAVLFSLRQKIENAKRNYANLISTTAIPEGHKLYLYNEVKEKFECSIKQNTKEYMVLSIPKNIHNLFYQPKELEKVTFYYQSNLGTAFVLDLRVIRYQTSTEEEKEMVVSHSNHLKCFQRRQFKRVDINNLCTFSAVKTTSVASKNGTNVNYEPMDKKHQGRLIELSAGGCSISTNLHIKEKQYIHIELSIDNKTKDKVIGLIVNTTENLSDNTYILHIVFVNIDNKTRNKIFSKVYEYLS